MKNLGQFLRLAARNPFLLLPGAPSGIINSAREWVDEHRRRTPTDIRRGPPAAYWEAEPPSRIVLGPPRLVEPDTQVLRFFPREGSSLFFFQGTRILGREGVVISPDNRVFADFTYVDEPGGIERHAVFRRRRPVKPKPLAGCYATLAYPSSYAYGHWLIESLPRVRLLEPYLDALDGIFIPSRCPPSIAQSLRALGVADRQIMELDEGTHWAPQHLLVPGYCAGLDFPPWAASYLREKVCGAPRGAPSRRLYISRSKTGRRRVLNEDELLPILARWGFEVIHPENLSFTEQARLFNEASVVLGPSGTAFVNVVFCQPGAAVIEIPPHPSGAGHYHYILPAVSGLDYWAVPGSRIPGEVPGGEQYHVDFIASPQALDDVLRRALAP